VVGTLVGQNIRIEIDEGHSAISLQRGLGQERPKRQAEAGCVSLY